MSDDICGCSPVFLNGLSGKSVGYEWRERCLVHGLESAWYNSPEQVSKRAQRNADLVDIQRQAREARKNVRNKSGDPR